MVKLFVATLIMPQGHHCKFKVYKASFALWEFTNNNGLTIYIHKASANNWSGTLSARIGNPIQQNNLITQAIFEVRDFYKKR